MDSTYEAGTPIEVRGEPWTIARTQRFDGCTVLTLDARDRSNVTRQLRVIEPFDRPRRAGPRKLRRRPRRAVLRAALGAIVSARRAGGLWVAAASRIDLLPYQLEPALAAVGGATRLLLADAVGLGKTIQAGLLLAELRERGWVERALIVCPAGLRATWVGELRERFAIDAENADHVSIAERAAGLPPGINPWAGDGVTVVSIDFIKRPEVIAALQAVPIDLLIVDEAHHLVPDTDRGRAMAMLACRAPWVALLSATPHSGDVRAFEFLTSLGSHDDRLVTFRRSRADVGFAAERRCRLLRVSPTAEEAVLFATVDRYLRDIQQGRDGEDVALQLVATTIARRSASSGAALVRTLRRRQQLLAGAPAEPVQPPLPWDEIEAADDVEADALLGVQGLNDPQAECRRLDELIELAGRCGAGSKAERLARLIDRAGEPALVFTEYRDTLDAAAAHLGSSRRVASIHGGLALDVRRGAVEAFNSGAVDILVATDAAGEGLNLHRRCRLVIDLELPWNPVRLEQRVGRVDRIGQRRTVHAIRLFHARTIEGRVLDRLQLRQSRADAAVSPAPANAADAAHVEASWAARQRRARVAGAAATPQCWSDTPRSQSCVMLFRTRFMNRAGVMVHERIDAREARFEPLPHRRARQHAIDTLSSRISQDVARVSAPVADLAALSRRIAAIRRSITCRRSVAYQHSLFDRRAAEQAARAAGAADMLDAALARTAAAVVSEAESTVARVELVAAWPGSRW